MKQLATASALRALGACGAARQREAAAVPDSAAPILTLERGPSGSDRCNRGQHQHLSRRPDLHAGPEVHGGPATGRIPGGATIPRGVIGPIDSCSDMNELEGQPG